VLYIQKISILSLKNHSISATCNRFAIVFKVEKEEVLYIYNKVERENVIKPYINMLIEQLKPEYIKSLRASLRSVRARNKRLGNSKVSSVTVDIDLMNSLNDIKAHYPNQKLTNADVIKLAVEALRKELAYLK